MAIGRRRRRTRLYRVRRARRRPLEFRVSDHVSREISGIFFVGFAILNFFALQNNGGNVGEIWKIKVVIPLFGTGSYFVPALSLMIGLALLLTKKIHFALGRIFGVFLFIISSLGLIQLSAPRANFFESSKDFGGYLGFTANFLLSMMFGESGAVVILALFSIISLLLIFNISFSELFSFFFKNMKGEASEKKKEDQELKNFITEKLLPFSKKPEGLKKHETEFELNIVRGDEEDKKIEAAGSLNKNLQGIKETLQPEGSKLGEAFLGDQKKIDYSTYQVPELTFLNRDDKNKTYNDDQLVQNAEIIRRKLEQFGIQVVMKDAHVGPTVIQYTLKPAEDVKLSKITTLKNDLVLALSAQAIRIEAPIPGKGLVGIEVPAHKRSIVQLGSIIASAAFQNFEGDLKIVLGRDVSGHPILADLSSMPHLLVAGQTGSGKSIGINSFLISFLYQHSPETLRLIMIDPKRVELTNYNGIPHLLTPVIIEPDKALQALKWAVSEMNRRYKELARHAKRNIDEYNKTFLENKMPFIVIIIDELADLMMAASKEIEATVCRIAQMARATGIHLIIATQRPSVDVITGLIKANIPTRIAYTVATGIDSRTIIDSIGAEDLIGQGDMLYLPSNLAKPLRLQGSFVSTKEIGRIIHSIKLGSPTGVQYDESITETHEDVPIPGLTSFKVGEQGFDGENDLEKAIEVIREGKKASASYLQRRLSFGYAKAARILDQLEEMGLIGPANGAKPRAIYITETKEEQTVEPKIPS